jgi:hypothetical protein
MAPSPAAKDPKEPSAKRPKTSKDQVKQDKKKKAKETAEAGLSNEPAAAAGEGPAKKLKSKTKSGN